MKSKRFPHMRNVIYIGQEKYRGMYNTIPRDVQHG